MTEPPTNGHENGSLTTSGGMGDLLVDVRGTRHSRRYARDIVQMMRFQLSSGETIFSKDTIVGILRNAGSLAEAATDARELKRATDILFMAVKLEQSELDREEPQKHEHEHTLVGVESKRAEVARLIQCEVDRREGPGPPPTNGHAGTNGHGHP